MVKLMKKILPVSLIVVLGLCFSFVFVGCSEPDPPSSVGVVYSVTFDPSGGTGIFPEQSVEDGKKVTKPLDPIRNGYAFMGWYEGSLKWDFTAAKVSRNTELVAKWSKIGEMWEGSEFLTFSKIDGTTECRVTGYSGNESKVVIPSMVSLNGDDYTVTKIDPVVFWNKESITEVVFGNYISEIGDGAFMGTNLVSVSFPDSLKVIGDSAFYFIPTLETIEFGYNSRLESIGDQAFMSSCIESFTMPFTLEHIGEGAFKMTNLKNLYFSYAGNLKTIGSEAFMNTEIVSVDIPEGVEVIGDCAFYGVTTLNFAVVPSFLHSVGADIFYGSGISCIYVRSSGLGSGSYSAFWRRTENAMIPARFYSAELDFIPGSWHYVNNIPTLWIMRVDFTIDFYDTIVEEGASVALFAYEEGSGREVVFNLTKKSGQNVYYKNLDLLKYNLFRVAVFAPGVNPEYLTDADYFSRVYEIEEYNCIFELSDE